MYRRRDSNGDLSEEFKIGLREFLRKAGTMRTVQSTGITLCPCRKCKNRSSHTIDTVSGHLYTKGFMHDYYVWYLHGEGFGNDVGASSSNYQPVYPPNMPSYNYSGFHHVYEHEVGNVDQYPEHNAVGPSRIEDMVHDAFPGVNTYVPDDDVVEEPNPNAKQFYDMMSSANQPLYDGCREGLSRLSLASRMTTIKSDHNLSASSMDDWTALFKEYLPQGNHAADSYYEVQKLVSNLGLPARTIDVCIDNCMLFWKDDDNLQECRFCHKPRYKPQGVSRARVPFQRMWYMPITDRLQRLYQSEQTAQHMRWHADHQSAEGEIKHPSDAKAWKHFQSLYPGFAAEKRNVYLALCTDGFKPFGMSGRNYSLWPVVVTPYNLPPEMCMQREFLFLSILVPGPKHPKKSLDVFLQPLIEELNDLWSRGARTFDFYKQRNFTMRAVLMWTISDFPAYGMLSGWTTHGRLACPYCLGDTDAHQLRHGGKSSWFDCHRRFLPARHAYRRNRTLFKTKKVVRLPPPVFLSGEEILAQIDYYGAEETVSRGGKYFDNPNNMPDRYHHEHNWHKKSIFWNLPYWKDHLLRHNLDVMHVEKNFFENIINTILNVPKRTKDNIKSRLDLAELCDRPLLHLTPDGKAPVPTFRLKPEAKTALFNWVATEIKFPDGYVSKLSKSVESGQKFGGMKSHDCHVFMQRLLPFAFAELLPEEVNEAIAGTYKYVVIVFAY